MATINGTNGDDTLNGTGSKDIINGFDGVDTIHGGAGDDTIDGGADSDYLFGDDGNDTIHGGETGYDHLNGGAGNDTLYAGIGGGVFAGDAGDDTIIGTSDSGDFADYSSATERVTVSLLISGPQVTGQGTDTLIEVDNIVGSSFDDVLIGDDSGNQLLGADGNDQLFGGNGGDLIDGGNGDDYIDGGAGFDLMQGGPGDDTYFVDEAQERVIEFEDSGTDIIYSSVSYSLFTLDLTILNVENLTLVGSADLDASGDYNPNILTGNSGSNRIFGMGGDDGMFGNDGNDLLGGGGGDDLVDGGQGSDTATYDYPDVQGVNVSLAISGPQYTVGAGTDVLISIENLTGSAGNDVLKGNAEANFLIGLDGDDRLIGGAGADTMQGGTGDDSYVVDNVGDVLVENAGEGTDTVSSSINFVLGDNIENLNLAGTAIRGTGNYLANRIVGNPSDNILDGRAGADIMRGGLGDDSYYVDNAHDNAIENAGEGTDTVFSSVNSGLGANVENLNLSGTAIRGSGNSLANRLVGTDGDNILDGGAGADVMRGGLGDDRYYVDTASDNVIEDSGAGRDRVYTTVSLTLGSNLEDLFARGSDAIDLTGNALDNVLRGNSAANVLTGGAGADDLRGGTGSDTFVFHDGDFAGLTPSTSDRIIDFSHAEGDHIDLAGVDANSATGGDQAFAFIGTAAFSHTAGELRYDIVNGNTYLTGDTNGDGLADFMVRLDGNQALVSGDFVL